MVECNEAFVTLITTDSYILGGLVLAHSLRDNGTSRKLVCLVTPNVGALSQGRLKDVFDEVILVDPIKSSSSANLNLLGRPDLLYTFTKLHVWEMEKYSKLVFLDADTLVLRNVDDLFSVDVSKSGIAACPDIGWPDCFNSGVFVTCPNVRTYNDLIQFGQSEGSFDGGDQGLLNDFFRNWNRLPFVYNVTPSATYSYAPAYRRFQNDIKIVHFIGQEKPWTWDRYSDGSPAAKGRKQEALDFVSMWWKIHDTHISKWGAKNNAITENQGPNSFGTYYPKQSESQFNQSTAEESTSTAPQGFFMARYNWDEQELGMTKEAANPSVVAPRRKSTIIEDDNVKQPSTGISAPFKKFFASSVKKLSRPMRK